MVPLQLLPPSAAETLQGLTIAPPAEVLELTEPLSASGIVVIDSKTGEPIFGQHRTTRRSIGSLTKLMTALLIVENHSMTEWVQVPVSAEKIGGTTARLRAGQEYTVGDLLSALLIPSANDAAETLAVFHSGTADAFVVEMNERAKSLGLKDTQYKNPAGMDDTEQWSTPQDLAWLTAYILKKPEIRERMSQRSAVITSKNGHTTNLTHTHTLLRENSPVVAGKTGTTPMARECLVSVVSQNGREYIVVLLKSLGRYSDMNAILRAFKTNDTPVARSGSLLPGATSQL